MNTPTSIAFRLAVILWCLTVVVAGILLIIEITQTVITTPIPFDIDESNHAIDGWEVYYALANGSIAGLYRAIVNQAFYPPLYSFFVATSYFIAGPGLFASRLPTVLNYALMVIGLSGLTYYLARRSPNPAMGPGMGGNGTEKTSVYLALVGAAFVGALAITSPTMIRNAVLCMLEITGALFLIPLIFFAERADAHSGRTRWKFILLAAVTVTLAFLTKYTFGLFFGLGLVAALVSSTWPWRVGRHAWREALSVSGIYLLVAVLWILITDRESLALFFIGHPSYVPFWSLDNFLFYPMIWLNEYFVSLFFGVFALTLAAVEAVLHWERLYVRVAVWSTLAALVILTISTTNEPRHILVVTPAIWLLAGLRLVEIFKALLSQPSWGPKASLALLLLLILFIDTSMPHVGRLRREMEISMEGEPFYSALQTVALQEADLDRPVLVVGDTRDQFNLLALRWRAAVDNRVTAWEYDIDQYPFTTYDWILSRHNRKPQIKELEPDFPDESLDAILEQGYYGTVITVRNKTKKVSSLGQDTPPELKPYPSVIHKFPGWEIGVYDLR